MTLYTFIGEDGSMGFKKGERYEIETELHFRRIIVCFSHLRIPYDSVEAFLKNWEMVK